MKNGVSTYHKAMARKAYSTDLSDLEWEILAPLIPPAKSGGHPRTTEMREVCNAIYYHLKTGCQWDSTVYSYYRKWQKRGIWEELNHTLRARLREKMGRLAQPSAIAADSQSVKTTEKRCGMHCRLRAGIRFQLGRQEMCTALMVAS